MFKMSLDKYYLATVTIQAFCAVAAPKTSKEAVRAQMLAARSSFAKSLPRMDAVQLNDTGPWQCDTKPDELIADTRASCDYITSKVQSNTSFLGDVSPEQFVNMTFEMVDALRSADKASFEWLQNASTGPRDAEVRKRTRLSVIDLIVDLLSNLEDIQGELRMPFGFQEDVLWSHFLFKYRWISEAVSNMLQKLGRRFVSARNAVNDRNDATDGSRVQYACEDFELKRATKPMMGGCGSQVKLDPEDEETWAGELMEYAMEHGFGGCEDNKCVPFFIARYAYETSNATDKLKISADEYARFLVFIQSVCASFPFEDADREADMRLKAVDVVHSLKEVLGQLSNLSTLAEPYKACAADYAWTAEVERGATYAVNDAAGRLNTSSWEDRQRLHELVANRIVGWLSTFNYRNGSTKASNLSKRIEEVENRFKTDIDGAFLSAGSFRALVALRCGYEFVWYELGYRYFPAGFATGDYVLSTQQTNKYKSNCGQIVFFP